MSSIIVISPPPPDPDEGGRGIQPRVRVTIEYDPPEFADPKSIKRTQKQLQKAADAIVARFG
ncbi:MAG: hypothetical protein QM813_17005 [Verrucomicrobiota bacterium]